MNITAFVRRWWHADKVWWHLIRHGERRSRAQSPTGEPVRPKLRRLDAGIGQRMQVVRAPPKFVVLSDVQGQKTLIKTYEGDAGAKARDALHFAAMRHDIRGAVLFEGRNPRGKNGRFAAMNDEELIAIREAVG